VKLARSKKVGISHPHYPNRKNKTGASTTMVGDLKGQGGSEIGVMKKEERGWGPLCVNRRSAAENSVNWWKGEKTEGGLTENRMSAIYASLKTREEKTRERGRKGCYNRQEKAEGESRCGQGVDCIREVKNGTRKHEKGGGGYPVKSFKWSANKRQARNRGQLNRT